MKVVSSKTMQETEAKAIEAGASQDQFMDVVGRSVSQIIQQYVEARKMNKTVYLLCGKGNNGGDAYASGVYLLSLNFKVIAFQVPPFDEMSELCKKYQTRFIEKGGQIRELSSAQSFVLSEAGVIVDGLIGTGLTGAVEEPYLSIIHQVNKYPLPIFAIDIPSGLDGNTGEAPVAIHASYTLFLGLPKEGYFLNEGWNHVGKLIGIDFGLPAQSLKDSASDFLMIASPLMKPLLPRMERNRHKYDAGVVVGVAGSPQMPGAALMASLATLRGGAGLMRLLYPAGMEQELSYSSPEIIKIPFSRKDELLSECEKATVLFVGPGIGTSETTRKMVKDIISKVTKPILFDADALTIIAEDKLTIPKGSILSPHRGELARLLHLDGTPSLDKKLLALCQKYVDDNEVTLIVKGAPTFIFHPNVKPWVNPFGDPGMATAGSGDVLTGLVAALRAQGCIAQSAALLGVHIHSIAGEIAAAENSSYSLIATDILKALPKAFKSLLER